MIENERQNAEPIKNVSVEERDVVVLLGAVAYLESAFLMGADWDSGSLLRRVQKDLVRESLVDSSESSAFAEALSAMNRRLRIAIGERPMPEDQTTT
jgi:hypothetical protein